MSKTDRSAEFLRNMTVPENPVAVTPQSVKNVPANESKSAATSSRTNLKHIGGYFDEPMVEKVAILRARLKLDNSALIKLAIEDLYRKHNAKQAFGD